jgi:hypothetical protein
MPLNFLLKIPLFNNLKEIMIIWYNKKYYSAVSLDRKLYMWIMHRCLFKWKMNPIFQAGHIKPLHTSYV